MKKLILCMSFVTACGSADMENTPDAGAMGAACSDDVECADDLCVTSFRDDVEITGGFCTVDCTEDNEICGDTAMCARYNPTGELYCLPSCVTDDDCRVDDGWYCYWFGIESACVPTL